MSLKEQLDRLVDELFTRGVRYDEAICEFEKRFISRALSRSEGNVGKAADLLGMHRNTLTRKIASYGIRRA